MNVFKQLSHLPSPEECGVQFYAHFSDAFVVLDERGLLNHVMGHSDKGIPLQTCPIFGPTLVVRHEHHVGEHIYCRNCGGEFALASHDGVLTATPTGKQGQATDLEPEIDSVLIVRTIRASVAALPIAVW